METLKERRSSKREIPQPPELGILYHLKRIEQPAPRTQWVTQFADVLDKGAGGITIRTTEKLEPRDLVYWESYAPKGKEWSCFKGKVVRITPDSTETNFYRIGLELTALEQRLPIVIHKEDGPLRRPLSADYEFFIRTKLLRAIPREAVCAVLNCISFKSVRAGERFISQGEPGDIFFVIQKGSCLVEIEKNGERYPISRRKEGEVLGEMAVLTGEPRSAHVYAETDMHLWGLTKDQFDGLSQQCPDLRGFLTELAAHRFESDKYTADRTIGKYRITDILGKGGYGIVYKGVHRDLNMPVAIKMMKHDLAMDPDFVGSFRNEAKTIAALNHENIIKVYDIEERYRTLFIITELLEGNPLDYLLEKMVRFSVAKALPILSQVCRGLAYAHKKGLVHLDMKPANIFVRANEQVKILDFGLSQPPGTEDLCGLGTPHYLSPEQVEGNAVDARSDIYSLGITAYEMVTGRRPFVEEDLTKLMDCHINQEMPDPRPIVPDLPEDLIRIIFKAAQKNPLARYQQAEQMLADLQQISERLGIATESNSKEPRKMMSLFLFYRDDQQLRLNAILEEFSRSITDLGATLKAAEFKDIE
ncbi:MAG: serine/threonine protein kinase [Desulfobacteraceae bacterium]|nr:MAG: serine/threonine protein kinase [Desulfobacteraceae bacterium]